MSDALILSGNITKPIGKLDKGDNWWAMDIFDESIKHKFQVAKTFLDIWCNLYSSLGQTGKTLTTEWKPEYTEQNHEQQLETNIVVGCVFMTLIFKFTNRGSETFPFAFNVWHLAGHVYSTWTITKLFNQ